MKVFFVRHARAGKRPQWHGDDRLRPLDDRGRRQAEKLVEQLRDARFDRIVSSPYTRCIETVEPLAHARGLAVETDEALAEGAGAEAALALFRSAEPTSLPACTAIWSRSCSARSGERAPRPCSSSPRSAAWSCSTTSSRPASR